MKPKDGAGQPMRQGDIGRPAAAPQKAGQVEVTDGAVARIIPQICVAQGGLLVPDGLRVLPERVFEVGPVFRAEPHDTTRHLNEYVSLDVEFGFIEDHFTVMALLRDVMAM